MKSSDMFYLFVIFIAYLNIMREKVLGDVLSHSEECALILEKFATASSNFMFCVLQNARPIHMCCSCVATYNAVVEAHEKVIQARPHQNVSNCYEKLVNQDRLEIIESSYSYIYDIWSRGQCENCFESGKNSIEPSNSTKEFGKLYSKTNLCLQDHYNISSKTYSSDVCSNCSTAYYKMNTFYSNLKETSGNGNVCMDIVDTMNVTQHLWSNVLHCGETAMTFEKPLILSATLFLLLPFCFYIGAWKFTKSSSSAVLHQNRLSQRFGERWRDLRDRTVSSISN